MLALIYFVLAVLVGDSLCRRFYQFESVAHRCATAILVGVLVSSWFVSVGAGFLLDATTSFVGQSAILSSGGRASVLA